jgi:hypothetical protein
MLLVHSGTFSDLVLFQHDALLFRDVNLVPEQQYALTKVLSVFRHMLNGDLEYLHHLTLDKP